MLFRSNTRPGSPIAKSGIRAANKQVRAGFRLYPVGGDILVGFQGQDINSPGELATEIDHYKAGDKVTFNVLRDNQKLDISVTLTETPPPSTR